MSSFKGSGKYSVNFEEIKEYNKILFNLITYFAETVCEGKDANVIRTAVEEVKECIRMHLREEERLLERLDYPYADAHKDRHLLFLDQIEILRELCRSGQPYLIQNILLSLKYWLVHHIFNFENEYVLFCESEKIYADHKQQKVGNS